MSGIAGFQVIAQSRGFQQVEAESGSKLRDPWRRHWRPEVPTLLPVLMVKMSLIVPVFHK